MKILIELFKREQIELPEFVFEVYKKVHNEEIELQDELTSKLLENEDVANSWILSLASSYKDRADFILARIQYDHNELSLGSYTKIKPANYKMIAPKLAKLHRITYIKPSSLSENEILREVSLTLSNSNNDHNGIIKVYAPPEECYVFESVILPKVDAGLIVFDHEYGTTIIDIGDLGVTAPTSKASKSKSSKKKKKRKKRSRRSRKVASASAK